MSEAVMSEPELNPLSPAGKEPAEGARHPGQGAPSQGPIEESHLGAAGDPAEGKPDAAD
jgi:hypothetical protein